MTRAALARGLGWSWRLGRQSWSARTGCHACRAHARVHRRRGDAAREGARLGRVRRPGAGTKARTSPSRTSPTSSQGRAQARQYGRHYVQNVPMVGITADPATSLVFKKAASPGLSRSRTTWSPGRSGWNRASASTPPTWCSWATDPGAEFQWDDYKGVDLAGKTVIMLINDPPLPDRPTRRVSTEDLRRPRHDVLRRWTYKYEMGAEKKAAASSSSTRPGRPRTLLRSSRARSPTVRSRDGRQEPGRAAIEAGSRLDQAKQLFALAARTSRR